MNIKILQLHKRDSIEYKYIQDKYAVNLKNKTLALSDGTTQSFKSEIWADLITTHFVENPNFDVSQLILIFKNCVNNYKVVDFQFSTNPAKASLEKDKQLKGGTATFIGVKFLDENTIDVISIGDSNLFILSKNNQLDSFPFSELELLDKNNFFLNSEQLLQDKIEESCFFKKTIKIQEGQKIILATDALSRLILQKPNAIYDLILLNNFNSFHEFCLEHWKSKELQEDDISAIIIDIGGNNKIEYLLPPKDFTFPIIKEEKFVFNPILKETSNKFTDMQIQEITNQFNGVANDFFEVKKKMKLLIVLLISIISLLLILLIFIYLFRTGAPINNGQKIINSKEKKTIQLLENQNSDLKKEIIFLNKKLKNTTPKQQKTIVQKNKEKIVQTDSIKATEKK